MTSSEPPAARRRGRPPSGNRESILGSARLVLRTRGAARLTTRDVAIVANVSEGSVFYHFTDKAGLLLAVIEAGIPTLKLNLSEPATSVREALTQFDDALEEFLEDALLGVVAAQSDVALRSALVEYLVANDMGPHRGLERLTALLTERQQAGEIRADADPSVLAYLFYSACAQRVMQKELFTAEYDGRLPDRSSTVDTFVRLISP